MELKEVTCLPTGRGIAAGLNGVWMVNIYAPFGEVRRRERKEFCIWELSYRMRTITGMMIVGGNFNCVLAQTDCIGKAISVGCCRSWCEI
jgi:hypothetical protein